MLNELFLKYGFSQNDYNSIMNTYPIYNMNINSLGQRFVDCFDFFLSLGYTNEDSRKIIISFPTSITLSSSNVLIKLNNLYSLGFSRKNVLNIVKNFPCILGYNIKVINQKFEFLKELGYNDDVFKIIIKYPLILGLKTESIKNKFLYFKSLNYSNEDIIKMTKNLPSLYGLSESYLNDKFSYFENMGFTKQDVRKITTKSSNLFCLSESNLEQKIKYFENLGVNTIDIKKIIIDFPNIFSLSEDNISLKIDIFLQFGYSMNEIIDIIVQFSGILGFSTDAIWQKLNFYEETNLKFVVLKEARQLMQSTKLNYARYNYLTKEIGINITDVNYRLLFIGNNQFVKYFGISKEELLSVSPQLSLNRKNKQI